MNKFIEVKPISIKKGKGAFAKIDIKKGTSINIGNVVLIPNKDYEIIKDTVSCHPDKRNRHIFHRLRSFP